MPLAWPGHVQQLTHFHGGGFGGELPELGMGDAFQYRVRVHEAGQPVEPVRPQPDRLGASGARCLLEAAEGRGHSSGLDDQQSIQSREVVRLQSGRDLVIHSRVDLGAQMVRQPFERAEGRQVGRGLAQRLDRSVDQVRRVTHRGGRLEHGSRDQLFACFRVGRGIEVDAHRSAVMVERRLSTALVEQRGAAASASCDARCATVSPCMSTGAGKQPRSWRAFSSVASVRRPASPRALARMKARSVSVRL